MRRKISVLVTAPSGAGKTTLVKKALSEFDIFEFSVSCTTRTQRPAEVHGKDYYFVSLEDFDKKITDNAFIEWEEVYAGTKYGTLKSEVDRIQNLHKIPMFDIDIMGAMSIKKIMNSQVVSIFIAPPSMEVLEARLRARHTETEEKILMRLQKAQSEMKFANFFDQKIVNDDLDRAYAKFKAILLSIV